MKTCMNCARDQSLYMITRFNLGYNSQINRYTKSVSHMVNTEAQTCMRDAQEPMRFVLACDTFYKAFI